MACNWPPAAVIWAFILSSFYVLSLYVWRSTLHRDHPDTIKQRFLSVSVMAVICPVYTYMLIDTEMLQKGDLWCWLGIRWEGYVAATLYPLLLTMALFIGPLFMGYLDNTWKIYSELAYWSNSLRSLAWLRNHVVAPFSEEWTFRACLLPILLPCFSRTQLIFCPPLFFGVAHFHHMIEKLRMGYSVTSVFLVSCHFLAPLVAHAFCNHMGFPDLSELLAYRMSVRLQLLGVFLSGVLIWMYLLYPLTEPSLYGNHHYKSLWEPSS